MATHKRKNSLRLDIRALQQPSARQEPGQTLLQIKATLLRLANMRYRNSLALMRKASDSASLRLQGRSLIIVTMVIHKKENSLRPDINPQLQP